MVTSSALASLAVEVFGLPITTLALLIAFRYEVYDSIQRYSRDLVNFVTAQVEEADDVTPSDVHTWSVTLRYAHLYRRSSDAVLPIGFASIVSWLGSVVLSRFNLFGLGSWRLPVIQTTSASMAAIFSFGLFSIFLFSAAALFYIDHSRVAGSESIRSIEENEEPS